MFMFELIIKHIVPVALLLVTVMFMYWNGKCYARGPRPEPKPEKEDKVERVEPMETKNVGEWFKTMFTRSSPWIN